MEREHTRWLQRKDHKFLSCSPFPCFGYRLFGRVFAGHGGSPPLFPDPATGFAASESSPGLSGGTADGSLCRDSVRCPTCCTAAGVDPPGTFRQLPVFGTVTQRSVARYILLCSPFRLFCVVFSICFHLLPPAWDTREILYRAPARYTEVSAEACLAHTRRIPGRVAYTCWQALEKCFDYEMKNTEIRASIAARNGIRAQISGIFWEQKCSFPRSNRGSVVSAGSFRGFPTGESRFLKKKDRSGTRPLLQVPTGTRGDANREGGGTWFTLLGHRREIHIFPNFTSDKKNDRQRCFLGRLEDPMTNPSFEKVIPSCDRKWAAISGVYKGILGIGG